MKKNLEFHGDGFTVHQLELGELKNFITLIEDHATKSFAIVDPAWEVHTIFSYIQDRGGRITDVILTHTHYDHVNGLDQVLHAKPVPVHISREEAEFWGRAGKTAEYVADGDRIKIGATEVEVIFTPGHTIGGICLLVGTHLITADTLFVYGAGRCDLPGGDAATLYQSLERLKAIIPDDVFIHPGHDYGIVETLTMAEQKAGNPFLNCQDEEDFVDYRMRRHKRSTPYGPSV